MFYAVQREAERIEVIVGVDVDRMGKAEQCRGGDGDPGAFSGQALPRRLIGQSVAGDGDQKERRGVFAEHAKRGGEAEQQPIGDAVFANGAMACIGDESPKRQMDDVVIEFEA